MFRALVKWLMAISVVIVVAMAISYFSAQAIWADSDPPPERSTGRRDVPAVRTSTTMVVAANPLASRAGHEILRAGGSAVDAAVAMQAVLTLVEPQSSGIGGGAFMIYYEASTAKLAAYNGRETAPARATATLFLKDDGTPMSFPNAVVGGRSVGVPGALRVLELAHRQHGRLPWARLFEPAIRHSEEGFEVSPRLHQQLRYDLFLRTQPAARAYFYQPDGRAHPVGYRRKNPELARVLRAIAEQGPDALYRGPIAEGIVKTVHEAQRPTDFVSSINRSLIEDMGAPYDSGWMASVDNPGTLSLEDLQAYRAKEAMTVCVDYRSFEICGVGPPTSGGITTLQLIKMLERFEISSLSPRSSAFIHLFSESAKLAFADRNRYIGDPDFVAVPVAGLLDATYLAARSKLIQPDRAGPRAKPGRPPGVKVTFADGDDASFPSTSHLVVVDAEQNVVSMTTTIEYAFGSHLMTQGFLLNNQLTDFSFVPERNGRPVANAVAPGKRPRSSLSPLIVFDRESKVPVFAVGSAGGSRIITYVARVTVAVLDQGLSPQEAIDLPHVVNRNGPVELEDEGWAPGELESIIPELEAMGHQVRVLPLNSGLQAVLLSPDGLFGGADPRREGLAVGD